MAQDISKDRTAAAGVGTSANTKPEPKSEYEKFLLENHGISNTTKAHSDISERSNEPHDARALESDAQNDVMAHESDAPHHVMTQEPNTSHDVMTQETTASHDVMTQEESMADVEEQVDTQNIIERSSQLAGVIEVSPDKPAHVVSQAPLDTSATSAGDDSSYIVLPGSTDSEGEASASMDEATISIPGAKPFRVSTAQLIKANIPIQSLAFNAPQTQSTAVSAPFQHQPLTSAVAQDLTLNSHHVRSSQQKLAYGAESTLQSHVTTAMPLSVVQNLNVSAQPSVMTTQQSIMTSQPSVMTTQQSIMTSQPLLSPNTLSSLTQMMSPQIAQSPDVTSLLQPIVERVLQNSAQAGLLQQQAQSAMKNAASAINPLTAVSSMTSLTPAQTSAAQQPQPQSTGRLVSIVSQLTKQAEQPTAIMSHPLAISSTTSSAYDTASQIAPALLALNTSMQASAAAAAAAVAGPPASQAAQQHLSMSQAAPQTAPIMSLVPPSAGPLPPQYPMSMSGSVSAPSTPHDTATDASKHFEIATFKVENKSTYKLLLRIFIHQILYHSDFFIQKFKHQLNQN